jgi:hypothetical protein
MNGSGAARSEARSSCCANQASMRVPLGRSPGSHRVSEPIQSGRFPQLDRSERGMNAERRPGIMQIHCKRNPPDEIVREA